MIQLKEGNEELIELIKKGVDVNENFLKIYKQNRGFIYNTVKKYAYGIYEIEDLMQQSFLALVKAVNYHNPDLQETNFLQILKYCIWNEIRELTGGLPAQMRNNIYKYRKTVDKLFNELGRQPKNYEIIIEMNIDLKQLEEIRKAYRFSKILSLDKPLNDENETTLLSLYSENQAYKDDEFETNLHNEELRRILDELLNTLPDESKSIIEKLYYRNMTPNQCGQVLNATLEQVRQKKQKALRKIRKIPSLEQKLDGYINTYKHIGAKNFNINHTSSVEWAVMKREEIRKRLEIQLE